MKFIIAIKEKIARVIGVYFTTNEIVNIFSDANIPADKSLYAKWRITLDAFGKMSNTEEGIPHILEVFCHPLNFEDCETRNNFIKELNTILAYDNLKIEPTDNGAKIVSTDGIPLSFGLQENKIKTSTDYILEAITFFKNEYNKIKMTGLTYEYSIGENYQSEQTNQDADDYSARLKAIERLKDAGFITEYTIEERVENDGYYIWDYAICKIDESKITQKEASPASESKVQDLIHKIQIVGGLDGVEKGLKEIAKKDEDTTIIKNKKKICLPRFQRTAWKDVEIRFLDEHNIHIKGGNKTTTADYEALGFSNDKNNKPNLAWTFLFGIAKNNGETDTIPSPIPDNVKQIKRQISDFLKKLFKNDTEPFYDFLETNTYKLKIKLIPPQIDDDIREDKLGVKEFLDDTMVSKYEEPQEETDW